MRLEGSTDTIKYGPPQCLSTVKNREVIDMANVSKGNALGILALIGALLMIIGVFVAWVDIGFDAIIMSKTTSYTGWEVYSDEVFEDAEYNYAPLVTLIAGIVAFFTAVIPIALKKPAVNRVLGILSLILGVVALVLMILFNGQMDSFVVGGHTVASISAASGFWVSLAGSVLLILGGIVDIAGKYTE